MKLAVKFIEMNKADVVATSAIGTCARNTGTYIYKGRDQDDSSYYILGYGSNKEVVIDGGDYNSIYDENGNDAFFEVGKKYHYDSGNYNFYLCDSDHELASSEPWSD